MSAAIEFNNVSKEYRLGQVSTRTLSYDMKRWWQMRVLGKEDPFLKIGSVNDRTLAADSDFVWALKEISFKIEQGDVVGIIGKNGAGKSTLLKLLSRVTKPTLGTIKVQGRIGALLEVGTGFHKDMTGRENIYLNGAILGMTKAEITRKLDEIIDFSGCERYIDTPVKRYSTGMIVRLGFAVAAFLEPEILVVDEVLAVGDAEFQKRAIGKMQDVSQGEGRTVLFVSHNMASVQRLCHSGVLLENGQLAYLGTAAETIKRYLSTQVIQTEYVNQNPNDEDKLVLLWAKVSSEDKSGMITPNSEIDITFRVRINKEIASLVIGFNVYSCYQHPLARADYNDYNGLMSLDKGEYEFHFRIPPHTLSEGDFTIVFDIAERDIKNYVGSESVLSFRVNLDENSKINIFSEEIEIKTSIVRQPWMIDFKKV